MLVQAAQISVKCYLKLISYSDFILVLNSFKVYGNEKTLSEATDLRMFTKFLDELTMKDTNISFCGRKTILKSTKRMKMVTEQESVYGCRTDLIVKAKKPKSNTIFVQTSLKSRVYRMIH